jgi:hypothetical protein
MDSEFYEALGAYEDGEISRGDFLENFPDDEEWLDQIDAADDTPSDEDDE